MNKQLERDLGLLEVSAISIGAMIGSGIFILPALALEIAGPAVVLAYLLAGLLVVPAALSKSEMATAMPEAGGTYIYIDRGMGPMLGTIAGIGTWFSLTFKSGLALVGGVPYVLPDLPVTPVALGLGVVLIVLNLVGTKLSGQFQSWLVVLMLGALAWFIFGSAGQVEVGHFDDFFAEGSIGILTATGFVFVSYAGVTKIASVAEEVEQPGRNIPLGMIGSLSVTTFLYLLLVVIMVGVVPVDQLAGSKIPMSDASQVTLGTTGVYVVLGAALLALISTANAGILSASRYPLAMARNRIFPDILSRISQRFGTPAISIVLTGAALLGLIVLFPLREIAKLASAFQILVFIIINLSLIALREGKEDYDPEYTAPLYPWMQIFGVVGGVVLLTQMGSTPMVGAAAIIAGGAGWYYYWGRREADREGAAAEGVRRAVRRKIVRQTRDSLREGAAFHALVALPEQVDVDQERDLIRLGHALACDKQGELMVMQFEEVLDQIPLGFAVERLSTADRQFETQSQKLTRELGFEATFGEIVAHDVKDALLSYAEHRGIDALVLPTDRDRSGSLFSEREVAWLVAKAGCDMLLTRLGPLQAVEEVAVVTSRGGYEPAKLSTADAIADQLGTRLRLIYPAHASAASARREAFTEYARELAESCRAELVPQIVEVEDLYVDLAEAFDPTDLAIVGLESRGWRYLLLDRPEARLVERLPCSSILYRSQVPDELSPVERLLERLSF
jgi:amino acid transporter